MPIENKPAVVWSPGPPEGPWESDPWVQVLREYEYERAVAWNALNFTDPEYTSRGSAYPIDIWAHIARGSLDDKKGYPVGLGPTPLTVMEVVEADDGQSARVYTCENLGWSITYTNPEPRPYIDVSVIDMVLDEEGNRRVKGSDYTEKFDCAGVPLMEGRFDPAPVPQPPGTFTVDDVYPPASE